MAQADNEANVRGILLALRYLTREAEGAGLIELARTLEEAELKCDRRTENTSGLHSEAISTTALAPQQIMRLPNVTT